MTLIQFDTPFKDARPTAAERAETAFMQKHGNTGAVALYRCVTAIGDVGAALLGARRRRRKRDGACPSAQPIPR